MEYINQYINAIRYIFKNRAFNNTILYTTSSFLEKGINFLRMYLVANSLGPALLGIWGIINLIIQYSKYGNLGIIYAMNKEVSINKTRLSNKNNEVESNTFTLIIFISLIFIFSGVIIYAFNFNFFKGYELIKKSIILIALIAALDQIKMFFENHYRAYEKFFELAISNIIFSFFNLVFIFILLNKYQLYSMVISLLIAYIATNLYLFIKLDNRLYLSFNIILVRRLILVGFPLMLYTLGYYIFTSVDQLFIVNFFQEKDLGYFTFSLTITGIIYLVIQTFSFILFPKVLNIIGNETDNKKIVLVIDKYTKYIYTITPLLVFLACVLMRILIILLFPAYEVSLPIISILLLGQFFLVCSSVMNSMFIAKGKQMFLIKLQLSSVIITIVLNYIFFKLHSGLIGVAFSTFFSMFIYGALQLFIGFKILGLTTIISIKKIWLYYKIFVLTLILVFASSYLGLI